MKSGKEPLIGGLFLRLALVSGASGFAPVIFLVMQDSPLKLDEIGAFLQGTTGVLWTLCGAALVAAAYCLQKRQLELQYSELLAARSAQTLSQQENEQRDRQTRIQFEYDRFALLLANLASTIQKNREAKGDDIFQIVKSETTIRVTQASANNSNPARLEAIQSVYAEHSYQVAELVRAMYLLVSFAASPTRVNKELISELKYMLSSSQLFMFKYYTQIVVPTHSSNVLLNETQSVRDLLEGVPKLYETSDV